MVADSIMKPEGAGVCLPTVVTSKGASGVTEKTFPMQYLAMDVTCRGSCKASNCACTDGVQHLYMTSLKTRILFWRVMHTLSVVPTLLSSIFCTTVPPRGCKWKVTSLVIIHAVPRNLSDIWCFRRWAGTQARLLQTFEPKFHQPSVARSN